MDLFWTISTSLAAAFLLPLAYHTRPNKTDDDGTPQGYRDVRGSFLIAWSLCVLADWFQGPYMYALYSSYGYSHRDIGTLFMVGFGTSGICGMFVGAFADSFGRKRSALLYVGVYIISCLTKHVNNFTILMLGRMAAGLATSLLFSVFESWLVYEYRFRHGYSQRLLSQTFSLMYALNYLVAISAGVMAQILVEMFPLRRLVGSVFLGGGIIAFDMAMVTLVVAGLFIQRTWQENYGRDQAENISSVCNSLADGARMVCGDPKLVLCALIVSLFESGMYIFIYSWTPLLVTKSSNPPLGIVFATFMMACAGGTAVFRIGIDRGADASSLLFVACFIATGAMIIPNFLGIGEQHVKLNYFASTLFELSVGIYFPAMSLVKSQIVQEECRATLYNIFRIPMNGIVIVVLCAGLQLHSIFVLLNATMLAALCMITLFMVCSKKGTGVGGMRFDELGQREQIRYEQMSTSEEQTSLMPKAQQSAPSAP